MTELVDKLRMMFFARRAAEKTLNDPGIMQAFIDLREAAHDTFANSAPGQTVERENAYWVLRTLDGLEGALNNRIEAHKIQEEMNKRSDIAQARAARANSTINSRPPQGD